MNYIWKHEYDVTIFTESGRTYKYNIEADNIGDAGKVAHEFFIDDYPDEIMNGIQILMSKNIQVLNGYLRGKLLLLMSKMLKV